MLQILANGHMAAFKNKGNCTVPPTAGGFSLPSRIAPYLTGGESPAIEWSIGFLVIDRSRHPGPHDLCG
ncbi:hypothetical protein Hanom_Chr10g00943371 [Helianthus anomalus]